MSGREWENSATKPILRLLNDSKLALSNSAIVYNLEQQMQRPPSKSTVNRALRGLRKKELVRQPQGSLYEITDSGRAYLQGELDIEKINSESE